MFRLVHLEISYHNIFGISCSISKTLNSIRIFAKLDLFLSINMLNSPCFFIFGMRHQLLVLVYFKSNWYKIYDEFFEQRHCCWQYCAQWSGYSFLMIYWNVFHRWLIQSKIYENIHLTLQRVALDNTRKFDTIFIDRDNILLFEPITYDIFKSAMRIK